MCAARGLRWGTEVRTRRESKCGLSEARARYNPSGNCVYDKRTSKGAIWRYFSRGVRLGSAFLPSPLALRPPKRSWERRPGGDKRSRQRTEGEQANAGTEGRRGGGTRDRGRTLHEGEGLVEEADCLILVGSQIVEVGQVQQRLDAVRLAWQARRRRGQASSSAICCAASS